MIQGPNVKKLIVRKMSLIAVPAGAGIGSALNFLTDPGAIGAAAREATEWVEMAIRLIREASGDNPWKDRSDEEIAGELLGRIGEREGSP